MYKSCHLSINRVNEIIILFLYDLCIKLVIPYFVSFFDIQTVLFMHYDLMHIEFLVYAHW